jgi:hypothetical protein
MSWDTPEDLHAPTLLSNRGIQPQLEIFCMPQSSLMATQNHQSSFAVTCHSLSNNPHDMRRVQLQNRDSAF